MASYGLVKETILSISTMVWCNCTYHCRVDSLGRKNESLSSSLPNISAIIFLSIKMMTKYEKMQQTK